MTTEGLSQLCKQMKENKLETIAINPGASLFYLTGLHFHLMERPVVLLIKPSTTPLIILPKLEALKVDQSTIPLEAITYNDDPSTWQLAFEKAFQVLKPNGKTIGIEPTQIRFLEMEFIKKAISGSDFVSAEKSIISVRVTKDHSEVERIRKAVHFAESALQATKPFIKIGRTEQEIASELTIQLLKAGSDTVLPFQPIVSSGPNSANPHAVPTERKLQEGDMLVIDWGASCDGYISDLTRTFAVESLPGKFEKISRTVLEANQAGSESVSAGVEAGKVDTAARNIIIKEGFGDYFTHRTGHGIGLEPHENPYIFSGNSTKLKKGMCFTIEPGIYLPGEGGVRIEDNVVVTPTGCEVISSMDRKVQILS